MKTADLLIDARGAEIQHRTGLTAPDAFIYLYPEGGQPTVYFDAREFDVKKQELKKLKNNVVIKRLEPYVQKVKGKPANTLAALVLSMLKEYKVKKVRISPTLGYEIARGLQEAGIQLEIYSYEAERERKTKQEIKHLISAQRVNETAFDLAWKILAESKIVKNRIIYKEEILTSERLKSIIRKHFLEKGYDCPDGIIVASGKQTARPHDEGSGPILPNQLIIIDIFPRSEATGYVADMTRTFVKGKPSEKMKRLYRDVEKVQREIADSIKAGDSCSAVHKATVVAFKKLGHQTSPQKGFMHGTGHAIGLQVHEGPRLSSLSHRIIEPGMVLTVEPGLYYPGIGGVRIEDVVIFHPVTGKKENITQFIKPYIIP